MSEITRGTPTEGVAYFCPKCHSPSLRIPKTTILGSEQAGVAAHCNACGWEGPPSELVKHLFKHEFQSEAEIAEMLMKDLRNVIAKTAAQTYGVFLMKWGFLDQPITAHQLAIYLEAIAKAIIPAVVAARQRIVEENSHGIGTTQP